ncbi:phosphatase PAP2 family protein [Janthinobacterium sp. 17J80-10]|uniref:phosphatase PAP2 family protein n=1 Tax=Janthinobacterium sp. 17J80-10 TaxID=2497863 RepID=UPI00100597F1|nr:phosphatase PAP2 family protein [Janthinobacterium sp. 17J80-10]QAU35214.1 phosphatase PAP2 family protein [Janthinobacterium sp. 17J80-10]
MLADLDAALFHLLNGLIGQWPLIDKLVHTIADDLFLRGTVIFFLLWTAWFMDASSRNREILLCGLVGTCVATLTSVFLQHSLMVHVRPLLDTHLDKQIAPAIDMSIWTTADSLTHLNSFPSDTATMYFSLAIAIACSNKRLGVAALAWTLFAIALPRVYLAYHYPSDVLGGFLLALAVQMFFTQITAVRQAAQKVLLVFGGKEYLLHAIMFVLVMDMANLFVGVRHALRAIPVALALMH